MMVTYSPPGREPLETEVPCEADPIPFALRMIVAANPHEVERSKLEDQLVHCTADGAPLK